MSDFDDRLVVVTGGGGGLGVAVVRALLDGGARVTVPLHEAAPKGPLAELRHASLAAVPSVDLTSETSVTAFYAALPGPPWASVHIAGGFAMKPLADTTLADLRAMHDLNVVTCFLSCREAVRAMRLGGAGGGRIVNVTARPALAPASGMIAYGASKAAVANLTQSLAAELLAEKILVNAVVPSIIDTPANRRDLPDADFATWPKAEEIARAIRFLASPANALTSGALVPVYGQA
jgi:NAD(P)-dependent dehydrogenase (short-subunit alcohol dehydrogenase family)